MIGVPQNFIRADRDQSFLMPPDVRAWLAEDELVWCVRDVVDTLGLSAFYIAYRANGQGRSAFDPATMVAVLIYAHATHTPGVVAAGSWRSCGIRGAAAVLFDQQV
jgi:hypothetical protein